jgi:hypothetical protein
MRLVKHSQQGNTAQSPEEILDFEEKFIKSSIFKTNLTLLPPQFLTTQVEIFPFCEMVSSYNLRTLAMKE